MEKRSGLSSEKRVSRVPAGKDSPKAMGRIRPILWRDVARIDFLYYRRGWLDLQATSFMNQDGEITREELRQLVWSKRMQRGGASWFGNEVGVALGTGGCLGGEDRSSREKSDTDFSVS